MRRVFLLVLTSLMPLSAMPIGISYSDNYYYNSYPWYSYGYEEVTQQEKAQFLSQMNIYLWELQSLYEKLTEVMYKLVSHTNEFQKFDFFAWPPPSSSTGSTGY